MKNLEDFKQKLPEEHYSFLKRCKSKVYQALEQIPDKMMLPPVIFVLSENNKMTHMMYDVNTLHDNRKEFEEMYKKIDQDLLEKGFDVAIYVCVAEASLKIVDQQFKDDIEKQNLNFENLSPSEYHILADKSRRLEKKDVVFVSAFTASYNYMLTIDRLSKKEIDETLMFGDFAKGTVSDVFNTILKRKINYDFREF